MIPVRNSSYVTTEKVTFTCNLTNESFVQTEIHKRLEAIKFSSVLYCHFSPDSYRQISELSDAMYVAAKLEKVNPVLHLELKKIHDSTLVALMPHILEAEDYITQLLRTLCKLVASKQVQVTSFVHPAEPENLLDCYLISAIDADFEHPLLKVFANDANHNNNAEHQLINQCENVVVRMFDIEKNMYPDY